MPRRFGSRYGRRRYVPVGDRQRKADRLVQEALQDGTPCDPVVITGRKIATTFWGQAWCNSLESHSDYSNRLPRGRTYVRNGSVFDLQIEAGHVAAQVIGTTDYSVDIRMEPLRRQRWDKLKKLCSGQIGSLVELLQGSISSGVMGIVTDPGHGLFPEPAEITLNCSCPDWATMCKHVAAALYGIGARLDHNPELLFTLRGVDAAELVEIALDQPASASSGPGAALDAEDLSSVFDIELDLSDTDLDAPAAKPQKKKKKTRTQTAKPKPKTKSPSLEQLGRHKARAMGVIHTLEPLAELIHEMQITRGRIYLRSETGGSLARLTPCKPGPLLLETPRKKRWIEVKRGQMATVLRALAERM